MEPGIAGRTESRHNGRIFQRNLRRPAQSTMQNNLNDPLLVQLQMLQFLWLKILLIAIYFLPFVGIWALGGRITSDAYDDLVCQSYRNAVTILRDLQFIMNPVMQPVVSVLLLLLARDFLQYLFHDDNNEAEP